MAVGTQAQSTQQRIYSGRSIEEGPGGLTLLAQASRLLDLHPDHLVFFLPLGETEVAPQGKVEDFPVPVCPAGFTGHHLTITLIIEP